MNYIKKIRIKLGAYLLRQRLKKIFRKPKTYNLKQAKTIGILFNSTLSDDIKTVKKLETSLKENNTSVVTLGYSNTKRNGETLIGDKNHHYIYLSDFNWYFKPQNKEMQDFINSSFDILINLYQDDDFGAEFIIKSSAAKFKVGCAHLDKSWHDLMIDVNNKKGDSAYLTEQINHYLSILNS